MQEPIEGAKRWSEALAQVLGGLAYAQLRVFQLSAAGTAVAPTLALADAQGGFAVEELERFRALRRRVERVTRNVEGALGHFRAPLDAFFDAAPGATDWLSLQVFHFFGDSIASDFAVLIANRLDEDSAAAVRKALGSRVEHETFALAHVRRALADDPTARERTLKVAGGIVGHALGSLREAMLDSDALAILLGGRDEVKSLVMELLANHRERLERLGLETVE